MQDNTSKGAIMRIFTTHTSPNDVAVGNSKITPKGKNTKATKSDES